MSVCYTLVFFRNGYTYLQTFSPSGSHIILRRVREKGIDSILAVILTNVDNFRQFLAQIILTIRVIEKL